MGDSRQDETIGRQVIAATVAMLAEYRGVRFEKEDGKLTVKGSPDGFDIVITDEGKEALVTAEPWYCRFDDPTEVAVLVIWLLSPLARIAATYKGDVPLELSVEGQGPEGEWKTFYPIYAMSFKFAKKTHRSWTNHIVKAEKVPELY